MTEHMPSPEVEAVFTRVSSKIDVEGATDAAELESRLQFYVDINKTRAKIAKRKTTRIRDNYRAEQVDKLIEHGFPDRVINEAIKAPKGIIAQTLLYGKEEAKRRVLEYRKQRIRGYVRAGVRPTAIRIPPAPETRRMRWRK